MEDLRLKRNSPFVLNSIRNPMISIGAIENGRETNRHSSDSEDRKISKQHITLDKNIFAFRK